MKQLEWMIANLHSVSVSANDHKASYVTAAQEFEQNPEMYSDMDPDVRAECVARNQIVTVQVYPDTPIGFLVWTHYDVSEAINAAYAWCTRERGAPIDRLVHDWLGVTPHVEVPLTVVQIQRVSSIEITPTLDGFECGRCLNLHEGNASDAIPEHSPRCPMREERARAWDEGCEAGWDAAQYAPGRDPTQVKNPHR